MNKQEIVEFLDMAVVALENNRDLIKPSLLNKIESCINNYKDSPIVQSILINGFNLQQLEIDEIVDKLLQVVDIERKLVDSPLTDKIISSIKELKERTFILNLIAAFV